MKIIAIMMFLFVVVIGFVLPVHAGGLDSTLEGVLNGTYAIESREVSLTDGRAEVEAAPGSATKIITTVFGKPVLGDLNGDGHEDAALILVHDPGGSGTFCYVAAAIAGKGNYQGTDAILLGDRVAPRAIQIRDGVIIVDYADRRPDESMASLPSIAKTMYLKLKAGRLQSAGAP